MSKALLAGVASAILAGLVLSTSAPAQQGAHHFGTCPAGYWQLDSLCMNQATGDVTMAEPAKPDLTYEPGCRPGYARLEAICQSPATGDVELADEKRWPKEAAEPVVR